jgi:hypothetical protein
MARRRSIVRPFQVQLGRASLHAGNHTMLYSLAPLPRCALVALCVVRPCTKSFLEGCQHLPLFWCGVCWCCAMLCCAVLCLWLQCDTQLPGFVPVLLAAMRRRTTLLCTRGLCLFGGHVASNYLESEAQWWWCAQRAILMGHFILVQCCHWLGSLLAVQPRPVPAQTAFSHVLCF